MKITILVGSLTTGGAERVAALWANGFHRMGHDVQIIMNNNNKPITYDVPEDIKIKNLYGSSKSKIAKTLKYIKQLRKNIKQERPDVIITVLEPFGIFAKIATIGLNIPIINTEHNAFGRSDYGFRQKFFKKYVNKLYRKVTVLTQADKDIIGNNLKDVDILPNPLAFPIKEKEENTARRKTILAVGRLNAYKVKGFDLLIKAWSRIASKYPDWKLRFVGEGSREDIETIYSFTEYNIESQVEFVNFTDTIINEYKSSELFVLSSRYEGFGMVLVEAMSQGCACITCDYGGRQQEIICNDSNGIVIPNNNVEALCNSIEELITNENKRRFIQNNAPQRAAIYSLVNIMAKWEKILKEVCYEQNNNCR